jgi:hypothetical protein
VILSVPNQVSNYVRQNSIGPKDTDYRVEPGNIPSDNTSIIADIAIIHISLVDIWRAFGRAGGGMWRGWRVCHAIDLGWTRGRKR